MLANKSLAAALSATNPLLKIAASIVLTGFAFSLSDLRAGAVLVGVLLALLVACVPIPARVLLVGLVAATAFTALGALLLGTLPAALINTLRLAALLLPIPLLSATTPGADLVRAFEAVRLSAPLVLGLTLTWRFLPVIQQEARRIWEANLLRGIDLTRRPGLWFSALFTPLIFRIVSYADEVTIGLETRGYDPQAPRTATRPLTWGTVDTLFTLGTVLVVAAVVVLEWRT